MIDAISSRTESATANRFRRPIFAGLALAAAAAVCAPPSALADDRLRVEGAFTVLYAYPSAVNYCEGGANDGNASVEAQGAGNLAGLGPLFLTVKKCYTFADSSYAGQFTLSAGNSALHGTYQGTQGALDENNFGPFAGVLTVTGGTGKFRGARGRLVFEAVAGPDSVGATASPTLNGNAFYLIHGTLFSLRSN